MIDNLYLNVGAMKAGTTWLFSHLSGHPDIHFSAEKEIHYFAHVDTYHTPLDDAIRIQKLGDHAKSMNLDHQSFDQLMSGLDWYVNYARGPIDDAWYERLFALRRGERYSADFSNLNSHLNSAGWDHVKSVARNVKVTYIMRHPMRRLWSHVKFHTKLTGEYEQMLEWDDSEMEKLVRKAFIWNNAEYSRVVKTLIENLEPDQLKIMFFEDIHENPLKSLRDLEAFLQIRRHGYDEKLLSNKVNVSSQESLPQSFQNIFRADLANDAREVEAYGLTLPKSWDDLFEAAEQPVD